MQKLQYALTSLYDSKKSKSDSRGKQKNTNIDI